MKNKFLVGFINLTFFCLWANIVNSANTCTSEELDKTCWECGSDCTARFDSSSHTLTVSGKGKMTDYTYSMLGNNHYITHAPWSKYVDSIENIDITGVSQLGNSAFFGLKKVTNIQMSDSVTSIGAVTFSDMVSLEKLELPESVKTISNFGLANNQNLKALILPAGITSLGTGFAQQLYSATLYCTAKQLNSCQNLGGVGEVLKYEQKGDLYYVYDEEGMPSEIYAGYANFSGNVVKESSERDVYEKDENGNVTLVDKNGKILGKYDKDGHLTVSYLYRDDGSLYVYYKDGNLLSISGKRIYTIDEATALVSKNGKNTFSIKYR